MLTPHLLFSEIPVHFAFIYFKNAEGSLDPEGITYFLLKDLWGSAERKSRSPRARSSPHWPTASCCQIETWSSLPEGNQVKPGALLPSEEKHILGVKLGPGSKFLPCSIVQMIWLAAAHRLSMGAHVLMFGKVTFWGVVMSERCGAYLRWLIWSSTSEG